MDREQALRIGFVGLLGHLFKMEPVEIIPLLIEAHIKSWTHVVELVEGLANFVEQDKRAVEVWADIVKEKLRNEKIH